MLGLLIMLMVEWRAVSSFLTLGRFFCAQRNVSKLKITV